MNKKHIVILGAGFGGINTYTSLPRSIKQHHNITIVDRRNHFLFTPLLPEVAGSSLEHTSIVEPIRDLIDPGHQYIQSTVQSVDTQNHIIQLDDRELSYDILVSALGSKTHFFGTPGADEYAYVLKTLEDAQSLRNRCIDLFEQASKLDSSEERKKILRFMVIGAGPTGAELTGELADLFFGTFKKQFGTEIQKDISLTLVNAGPEILGMFDKSLRDYAQSTLVKDGVQVMNNVRVAEVKPDGVVTADGDILSANTIVWTAGVTANSLPCSCGAFEVDRGKILIGKDLRAKNTDDVFVIGDLSLFPSEDGCGLPPTAQVAKQQGVHAAQNIVALLNDKKLSDFVYREKGLLASLGSYDAVAQIKGMKFRGPIAWFMWRTIYLFNFASWKKRIQIMFDWTMDLFSGRDTTRL